MSRMNVYCMHCKTGQAVNNIQQAEDWAGDHQHPEAYGRLYPSRWARLKKWLGL